MCLETIIFKLYFLTLSREYLATTCSTYPIFAKDNCTLPPAIIYGSRGTYSSHSHGVTQGKISLLPRAVQQLEVTQHLDMSSFCKGHQQRNPVTAVWYQTLTSILQASHSFV